MYLTIFAGYLRLAMAQKVGKCLEKQPLIKFIYDEHMYETTFQFLQFGRLDPFPLEYKITHRKSSKSWLTIGSIQFGVFYLGYKKERGKHCIVNIYIELH